jgi:hypothetical protein
LTIESGISFGRRFGACKAGKKDLSRDVVWGQSTELVAERR